MELVNRFAALDVDSTSDTEDRHTPPYPPVRGTTPIDEKVQDAAMVAKIWERDEEMKNNRFRDWNNDNTHNGFATIAAS